MELQECMPTPFHVEVLLNGQRVACCRVRARHCSPAQLSRSCINELLPHVLHGSAAWEPPARRT